MKKIKNFWKKMKYWQKGIILFLFLYFIINIISKFILNNFLCTFYQGIDICLGNKILNIINYPGNVAIRLYQYYRLTVNPFTPGQVTKLILTFNVLAYIINIFFYVLLGGTLGSFLIKKIEIKSKK